MSVRRVEPSEDFWPDRKGRWTFPLEDEAKYVRRWLPMDD